MCDEITTADGRVLFKIDEDRALSVFIRADEATEWSRPVVFDADELWAMVMPDVMIARGADESPPDC